MKLIYILGLLLIFSSVNCSKEKEFTIDVSRITNTDALGNSNGNTDNTDWGFDANWNETELSLFRSDPVDMSGAETATITLQPAYPNPASINGITFQFTASKKTYLRLAVVDEKLNRLAFYSFFADAGLNAFNIPFNIAPFTINKNYRIYYTFNAAGNEMYFKGHGDVAIR